MSDETRNIIDGIEDSQLRNIIEVAMTLDKVDRSVLLMQAQALKAGMDIRAGKEQEGQQQTKGLPPKKAPRPPPAR